MAMWKLSLRAMAVWLKRLYRIAINGAYVEDSMHAWWADI
jgi:hypothetical protein